MRTFISVAAVAAALAAATPAVAAPILGSNVEAALFSSTIGSTSGWSYAGQSVTAFSGGGTATLVSRNSSYANSFGTSNTAHGSRATLFGTGASTGASAAVTGTTSPYLFYFQADGADLVFFSDDNRQYTDGFDSGGNPGRDQGDIDIFFNAMQSKWAFFFDDAGGGIPILGDDNDFNDMVVTFQQTSVPEPGSLALLGLSLFGVAGFVRRRAQRQA